MNWQDAFNRLDNKGKCLEMWNWLVENPSEGKYDFFKAHNISPDDEPTHQCYACVTGFSFEDRKAKCDCPVEWTKGTQGKSYACEIGRSPYRRWLLAGTQETNRKYALQVLFRIEKTWKEDKKEKWIKQLQNAVIDTLPEDEQSKEDVLRSLIVTMTQGPEPHTLDILKQVVMLLCNVYNEEMFSTMKNKIAMYAYKRDKR